MTTIATATDIRPFTIAFSDEELDDLRRRIEMTRWPDKELVGDASQGVQVALLQEIARYWKDEYDWRRLEDKRRTGDKKSQRRRVADD